MNGGGWAGIHLITPVWGEDYTRCFVDLCLPALLASGNIPVLSGMPNCVYNIYTTPEDRGTIEASAAYRKLASVVAVRFHALRAVRGKIANQYVVQSECYRHGIAQADAVDAAMIFISPDIVVADGGFRSLLRIARSGKRAILGLGIRINKEAAAQELASRFRSPNGDTISVEPAQLVRLALRNLHAISKAHLFHGEGEPLHPAGLFWRIGDKGLLARCFHLHPILVHPRNKNASFSTTIDEDYLSAACPDPADAYVIDDSDEFCACELSDSSRRITTIPRTSDSREIARWAFFNANQRHRELVKHSVRFHAAGVDTEQWSRTQQESDAVVGEVLKGLSDPGLFGDEQADGARGTAPVAKTYLPLHFVTPVWGSAYAETFVTVTLPTILSLGNIPAVPNKHECRYTIYTDEEGRRIIEASRAYAILREYVSADIKLIREQITNKYVTSSNCYREVVHECAKTGAAAVFLIPDMILSDGSIRFLANVLRGGKRQVLITGVRLVKETAVPELLQHYSAGGVVSIAPADLIRLALAHLHPITRNHLYEGQSDLFHPAGMYWRVADQGLLLRCFHLHPVAVVPSSSSRDFAGTIDDDLLEASAPYDKDIFVVTNSDQIQWCEISSRSTQVPTPPRIGTEAIAQWMENNTSAFHRSLIHNTIRVHTGNCAGPQWTATEIRAEAAVRDVLKCFEAMQRVRVSGEPAPAPSERTFPVLVSESRALVRQALRLGREFVALAEGYIEKPSRDAQAARQPLRLAIAHTVVSGYVVLRWFVRAARRLRRHFSASREAELRQSSGLGKR